ncbi:MAG: hypothetical protein R3C42_02035 [Parvularculaceae bacterium]|nr:hypothetical protein [Parvularculaceae bacterium]
MKLFIALGFCFASLSSAAYAGEMADACVARLEADGRDASGCGCIEAEVEANPALEEEFRDLAEIDDPAERYAAASDEARDVMDSCTR